MMSSKLPPLLYQVQSCGYTLLQPASRARMMVKQLWACALWSSERAVSGIDGSVMTSALPNERNQSHDLFFSLSHHSHNCQNGISRFIICYMMLLHCLLFKNRIIL